MGWRAIFTSPWATAAVQTYEAGVEAFGGECSLILGGAVQVDPIKPELKPRLFPARETKMWSTALKRCFQIQLAPLHLGSARIYDALNEMDKGVKLYKQVLVWDAANVEAIACLASHHFYTDQPEIALRFYRRLLQMGRELRSSTSQLNLSRS